MLFLVRLARRGLGVLSGHARVERGAIDAEQLGGLRDVAARQAQRCLDVSALPGPERLVEVERAAALELALRLLEDAAAALHFQLDVELRLELGERDALAGIFRRQP